MRYAWLPAADPLRAGGWWLSPAATRSAVRGTLDLQHSRSVGWHLDQDRHPRTGREDDERPGLAWLGRRAARYSAPVEDRRSGAQAELLLARLTSLARRTGERIVIHLARQVYQDPSCARSSAAGYVLGPRYGLPGGPGPAY
jgi:hypothetical protein